MDKNTETLYELLNPEFIFSFNGKEYKVKKANLTQAIQYQEKARQLIENKEAAVDLKLAAFCIYLILSPLDSTITEKYVLDNAPGDLDPIAMLGVLGFMKPQQVKLAKEIIQETNNPTT